MSRRVPQLSFVGDGFTKPKDWFGGSYLKRSNAKARRPLSSKLPIHVVMRSEKARGGLSFLTSKNNKQIKEILRRTAKKHGIRIYEFANVGNHLHLLIRLRSVRGWAAFIRELSGRIAQAVQELSGREKGIESFWDQRPFTRVVQGWGRAYRLVKDYVIKNILEGEGLIPRADFKSWNSA